jgi:hypothetical protein
MFYVLVARFAITTYNLCSVQFKFVHFKARTLEKDSLFDDLQVLIPLKCYVSICV